MEIFINILTAVSALIAIWLWGNLPNKFFQFVVGAIAIIFGVSFGISSDQSVAYRNAARAAFFSVIGFYALIRLIDWRVNRQNGSLFKKEKEKKQTHFRF